MTIEQEPPQGQSKEKQPVVEARDTTIEKTDVLPGIPLPEGWDEDLFDSFASADTATHREIFFGNLKQKGLPVMSVDEFFERKNQFLDQCAKVVSAGYVENEQRLDLLKSELAELQKSSKAINAVGENARAVRDTKTLLRQANRKLQEAQELFDLRKRHVDLAIAEQQTAEQIRPGALARFFNTTENKTYTQKKEEASAALAHMNEAAGRAGASLAALRSAMEAESGKLAAYERKQKEAEEATEYKIDTLKISQLNQRIFNDPFERAKEWLTNTYLHSRTDDGEMPHHLDRLDEKERIREILIELGYSVKEPRV